MQLNVMRAKQTLVLTGWLLQENRVLRYDVRVTPPQNAAITGYFDRHNWTITLETVASWIDLWYSANVYNILSRAFINKNERGCIIYHSILFSNLLCFQK